MFEYDVYKESIGIHPSHVVQSDHALVFHSYLLRCQRGRTNISSGSAFRGFLWHLQNPRYGCRMFRRLGMVHTCARDLLSPLRNHPFWECWFFREKQKLQNWGAPKIQAQDIALLAQGQFGGSMQEPASSWLFFEKAKVKERPKTLVKNVSKEAWM